MSYSGNGRRSHHHHTHTHTPSTANTAFLHRSTGPYHEHCQCCVCFTCVYATGDDAAAGVGGRPHDAGVTDVSPGPAQRPVACHADTICLVVAMHADAPCDVLLECYLRVTCDGWGGGIAHDCITPPGECPWWVTGGSQFCPATTPVRSRPLNGDQTIDTCADNSTYACSHTCTQTQTHTLIHALPQHHRQHHRQGPPLPASPSRVSGAGSVPRLWPSPGHP